MIKPPLTARQPLLIPIVGIIVTILGLVNGCSNNCTMYIQYRAHGYVPEMLMKIDDSVELDGSRMITIESPNKDNVSQFHLPAAWREYMDNHGSLRVVVRTTHKGVDTLVLNRGACDTVITYDLGDKELKTIF